MEDHWGRDYWYKLLYSSRVWKSIWVNILYGNYFTLLEYVRRLGQDSWSNLLYISVIWKDIWVKVLGTNYYTLLMYGRPFRLQFFMEITVHFQSTEGYLFQESCWKGNCYILLEYGRPFRLRFLVEIPLHFWSMEGHLG